MSDLNRIEITGRVSKIDKQEKFVKFTVPTNKIWKNKNSGEFEKKVTWHEVVCFGYSKDKAKDLEQGDDVFVSGLLAQNEWTDKEGNKRTSYNIELGDLVNFSKKKRTSKRRTDYDGYPKNSQSQYGSPRHHEDDLIEDDVPF